MTLFGVPLFQHDLISALINLYNKDDAEILKSTEIIEKYIETHQAKISIPPGLLQSVYGSVRIFSEVIARGIGRGLGYLSGKWGCEGLDPDPAVPLFLISIAQRSGVQDYQAYKSWRNAALFIIKKFLGVELTQEYVQIFLSLISADI